MTTRHKAPHARLFAEPEARGERPEGVSTAYIDGASRGNPGPASYAVILVSPEGKTILELGKYIGRGTNNVAEYYGLISALDSAASWGICKLRVRSDSELLVRQMEGRYKVKSNDLKPFFERAQRLARGFAWFGIEYIPREKNYAADRLANDALDRTAKSSAVREGTSGETRKPKSGTRNIRARYANGTLTPSEPLDLPDGAEVEITIRKAPQS